MYVHGLPFADETARPLVGRGWWPLLERVYAMAEAEEATPLQIKENGGGLRIAWSREDVQRIGWDTLYGLSLEPKSESYRTCEACGEPGEPVQARGRGDWRKTLCLRHTEMRRQGAMWHQIMGFQPYTTPREEADWAELLSSDDYLRSLGIEEEP